VTDYSRNLGEKEKRKERWNEVRGGDIVGIRGEGKKEESERERRVERGL